MGEQNVFDFNPRAPRGARHKIRIRIINRSNFNPRAPRGARRNEQRILQILITISIHVPREGHDLYKKIRLITGKIFQSTCPARGTTRSDAGLDQMPAISIHVPREGHDAVALIMPANGQTISIHVPREGHDLSVDLRRFEVLYFNPRAPRGARPIRRSQEV